MLPSVHYLANRATSGYLGPYNHDRLGMQADARSDIPGGQIRL
jgi:hypothetical protein